MEETPIASIATTIERLRISVVKRLPHHVDFRKAQLHQLVKLLHENRDAFVEAMVKDLKTPFEAEMEVSYSISEAISSINSLDEWVKPQKHHGGSGIISLAFMFDSKMILHEPLGLVLIISPWNYPALLSLLPVIGAIAAGNCVILKPSEVSGNTSNFFLEKFQRYLDPACYAVVSGNANQVNELLKHPFDHVLFTGGGNIGKIVYEKAAKFLTPVTLELGGKW